MDESLRERRAKTFGAVADVYERARPDYPVAAVRWVVGSNPAQVLELGAGTGKLTSALLDLGHQVIAADPAAPMLGRLHERLPRAKAVQATAEHIPLAAASTEVVVMGQAFHWFDDARALPEIARVLRPDGAVALLWNVRDESVPWVRRLSALIGSENIEHDPAGLLTEAGLFTDVEKKSFRHWQQIDRDGLLGLVESRSYVATLGADEREVLLAKVGALYDEYGRGHDGMQLPYRTDCYRARLSNTSRHRHDQRRDQRPPVDDGLLIDFS